MPDTNPDSSRPMSPTSHPAYRPDLPWSPAFGDDLPAAEHEARWRMLFMMSSWLQYQQLGRLIAHEKRIAAPTRTGLHVLVVEDDPANLMVMRHYLQGRGYVVHAASGSTRAMSVADSIPIDLVISDIVLIDGNGHDLMRSLKAKYRLKGIAISVRGSKADIELSRAAGFEEHLIKPVNFRALSEVIHRVAG